METTNFKNQTCSLGLFATAFMRAGGFNARLDASRATMTSTHSSFATIRARA